jgi:hypothetical protein
VGVQKLSLDKLLAAANMGVIRKKLRKRAVATFKAGSVTVVSG